MKLSLLDEILQHNHQPVVNSTDFYYSCFAIVKLLERKIQGLLDAESWKNYFTDHPSFIENISGQVNLFLKNSILPFVLTHELSIAKDAEVINVGQSSGEVFSEYIDLTNNDEWIEYCFEKYPALAQQLSVFINNQVSYLQEILERVISDERPIKELAGVRNYKIWKMELFLGDLHNHNRHVCLFEFEEGEKVLYKPRAHHTEQALMDFMEFLQSIGADITADIPAFVSFGSYSWVSFIEYTEVKDWNTVKTFYKNHGKLLCLFYLLGSTDIIPDNIIVSDGIPYFIDVECLLSKPKAYKAGNSINGYYEDSVIRTGMLPNWMQGEAAQRDILSSVFFEYNKQKATRMIWEGKGSGDIKLQKTTDLVGDAAEKHLPCFKGQPVALDPGLYEEVVAGYKEFYDFLVANRQVIVNTIRKKDFFKNVTNRIIVHATALYTALRREQYLPEYMAGKLNVDELILEAIKLANEDRDNDKLFDSIRKQITNNDIPFFYVTGNDKFLYDSEHNIIDEGFDFDSKDATTQIIQRLKQLGEADYQFQNTIVRSTLLFGFEAFNISFVQKAAFIDAKKGSPTSERPLNDKLLECAVKIGDFLLDKCTRLNGEVNWISKTRDQLDGRYAIMPMNFDVYDGISGISVFMAYLSKYTGDTRYLACAKEALQFIERITQERLSIDLYSTLSEPIKQSLSLSPFGYPNSYLYLLSHLHPGLDDKTLSFKLIEDVLIEISGLVDENIQQDFMFGRAGLLHFLLNLKHGHKWPLPVIDILIQKSVNALMSSAIRKNTGVAWEYIDAFDYRAKKYLGGFAHGTGGVSSVLFRVATLTNDNAVYEMAGEALKYDRSLFDNKINGWIDGRTTDANYDAGCWCHGSAGIALSRLLISQYVKDDLIEQELRIAAGNIFNNGIGGNQSVCHGDMGNLEVLHAIAQHLDDAELKQATMKTLNTIADQFLAGKQLKTGDDAQLGLYSLFMGYAGSGYQFLRMYDWKSVPSILCLESPFLENKTLH